MHNDWTTEEKIISFHMLQMTVLMYSTIFIIIIKSNERC